MQEDVLPWAVEVANGAPWTLVWDSLHSQRTWQIHNLIRNAGGQGAHGPTAKTEAWQPIDRGLGMLTKVLAGEFQTTWLDQDWERWNSKSMHIAEFQVIAMNLTPIELPDKYLLRQLGRLPCA